MRHPIWDTHSAMSAPNSSFDPKQVAALDASAIDGMVGDALMAIADAGDLGALKDVRLAHSGDRSPLALANREIGALPPAAKAEAGKRIGEARGANWRPSSAHHPHGANLRCLHRDGL